MSLLDEVQAEVAQTRKPQRSKIEVFLETLPPEEQAQFNEWLKAPTETAAMWRVLKRRGLKIAEPTFRAWVVRSCP